MVGMRLIVLKERFLIFIDRQHVNRQEMAEHSLVSFLFNNARPLESCLLTGGHERNLPFSKRSLTKSQHKENECHTDRPK